MKRALPLVAIPVFLALSMPALANAEPMKETRTYVSLRGGTVLAAPLGGQVSICGRITPFRKVSIEGCGSGAQLFAKQSEIEMSHYHLGYTVYDLQFPTSQLDIIAFAGFSELALPEDGLGFTFGNPGDNAASVSGPSTAIAATWSKPLGRGVEWIANANLGVAALGYADKLADPQDTFQFFTTVDIGFGY